MIFIHPVLLEKYDKTVRDKLSNVCNVNFDEMSSTHLAVPSVMGGLGVVDVIEVKSVEGVSCKYVSTLHVKSLAYRYYASASCHRALR